MNGMPLIFPSIPRGRSPLFQWKKSLGGGGSKVEGRSTSDTNILEAQHNKGGALFFILKLFV